VYSREIDGDTLTLSASGWTYDWTFVLYDYETESIWYHVDGTEGLTCVGGFYADHKLAELNSTKTRWNADDDVFLQTIGSDPKQNPDLKALAIAEPD
jgi:hypothetical protein